MPVALTLLDEAEQIAPTKAGDGWVSLYVSGATLPLYLIYRHVLRKRGYRETLEHEHEYTPELRKDLR